MTAELIYTFLDRLCEPHWEYCIDQGLYDRESADAKKRRLRFSVMGMLLFYQNRLQPDNYKDFIAQLNDQAWEIVGQVSYLRTESSFHNMKWQLCI